jgi:hypothetical protein
MGLRQPVKERRKAAIDCERITLRRNVVKQTWPHHSGRVDVGLTLALFGVTSLYLSDNVEVPVKLVHQCLPLSRSDPSENIHIS